MNKPFLTSTAHTLPFDQLSASTFERLCLWLVRAKGYLRAEHYGLAGSEQGRDVIAYLPVAEGEELWYFQCKRYKEISAPTLTEEVDKVHALSKGDAALRPKGMVFVITCAVSAKIRTEVKSYCRRRRLGCEFWAHTELDMYVKEYSHLVEEFFSARAQIEAIADSSYRPSTREPSAEELAKAYQLLESMPTSAVPEVAQLPPRSQVIYAHNPLFVGRAELLQRIAGIFRQNNSPHQAVVVTGIGGIGKTQLASEFAHRYGQFFIGGVFWLNFANPELIPIEIAACGGVKHLSLGAQFEELPLDAKVDMVLAQWDSALPRLLVFDNCEDDALFVKWRRVIGGCRILVTSRRLEWSVSVGAHMIQLGMMSHTESIGLLSRCCPKINTDDPVVHQIAEELGNLPLALHLAGSFLSRYWASTTTASYLEQLRRPNLLAHPSLQGRSQRRELSPTLHEQNVARTFALSYERLQIDDEVDVIATKILARASQLAPDSPIYYRLLLVILDLDDEDTDGILQAQDAIHRLLELGLFEKEDEEIVRLHRLIALFARDLGADSDARSIVQITLLDNLEHWNAAGYGVFLAPIQPHLLFVLEEAINQQEEISIHFSYHLGWYFYLNGDFRNALKYTKQALDVSNKRSELVTSDIMGGIYSALGVICRSLNDLVAAKEYYEQAIEKSQELKISPLEQATLMNNIGMLYNKMGDTAQALSHYQSGLDILEGEGDSGDGDSAGLAAILNNLGLLYIELEKLDDARQVLTRALEIRKDIFGEEHQRTAETILNLGGLMLVSEDYKAARDYFEQALKLYQMVLLPDHLDIGRAYLNLAGVYKRLGEIQLAKQHYVKAVEIYENTLGSLHPDTVGIMENLVELLWEKEKDGDDVIYFLRRLIELHKHKLSDNERQLMLDFIYLGDCHFDRGEYVESRDNYNVALKYTDYTTEIPPENRMIIYSNLAKSYEQLDDLDNALTFFRKALEFCDKNHDTPKNVLAYQVSFVANILHALGRHSEATRYFKRAIALFEENDSRSQYYAAVLNNFATVLRSIEPERSVQYFQRALTLTEEFYSINSREYVQTLNNLAVAYRIQNNFVTARLLLARAYSITKQIVKQDDPLMTLCIHNYATLLYYEGDYENAAILVQQALSITERQLGVDHLSTLMSRGSLANVLKALGRTTPLEGKVYDMGQIEEPIAHIQGVLARAEAAAREAMEDNNPIIKSATIDKLLIAADAFASGQPVGSPYLELAEKLRRLADQFNNQ